MDSKDGLEIEEDDNMSLRQLIIHPNRYLDASDTIDILSLDTTNDDNTYTTPTTTTDDIPFPYSTQTLHYNLIWILLTLSLTSIALHIVILLHVKSSAPLVGVIEPKRNKGGGYRKGGQIMRSKSRKVLAYWIYDRYRSFSVSQHSQGMNDGAVDTTALIQENERDDRDGNDRCDTNNDAYVDSNDGNNSIRSEILYGDYDPLLPPAPPAPLHSETTSPTTMSPSSISKDTMDDVTSTGTSNYSQKPFIQHIHSSIPGIHIPSTTLATGVENQDDGLDVTSIGGATQEIKRVNGDVGEGQPRRRNRIHPERRGSFIWGDRRPVNLSGIQACFSDGYDGEFSTV